MSERALLEGESLARTFGSGPVSVHAVRGVDLTLERGERLMIMGPSGSGKTTLVAMLAGLLTPTAGAVRLHGEDLYRLDEARRARVRLRSLGFVFQSFNLLSALTARENIELPIRMAGGGRRAAGDRAEALLRRFGLELRADSRPGQLSGGEKQRVSIARALANDCDIVLADEPTANLDSESGREVGRSLERLAVEEGKGVIVVSHDERLTSIASRIVRIEDGRVL